MSHRIENLSSIPTPTTPKSEKTESERKELFGVRRNAKKFFYNLTSSDHQLSSSSEALRENRFSISNQATPPPRLPSINSDLLGMMKEREKEQSQSNPQTKADSRSTPNSTAPCRRRELQHDFSQPNSRRMAGSWKDWQAASEELKNDSPKRSPAQARPAPSSNSSAVSDQQKQDFIAEMSQYGFTFADEDLEEATPLTFDMYRSFLILDQNNSPETKKKEDIATTPHDSTEFKLSSKHAVFTSLYLAVAKAIDPKIGEEHIVVPLELPPTFEYTDSKGDKGGHGGSKTATIEYKGQVLHLYLKPKQEAEVRGYRLISLSDNRHEPKDQVGQFMPRTYGVVEIDGQEYFVMQNLRAEDGNDLLDAKLSYLIDGLGAIADRDEIETTGRKKHTLDYFGMQLGAKTAPGFMVSTHSNKALRLINYKNSKQVLKDTLAPHFTRGQLIELSQNLVRLQKCIAVGDIAYIGTSVLFLEKGFKFIDPAHIQVNPSKRNQYGKDSKIFYGAQDDFELRKAANIKSIGAIDAVIQELIEEKNKKQDWEL